MYPASGPDNVGETERIIGRWMTGRRGGATRRCDEAVLATKFWAPTGPQRWQRGGGRRHIIEAVEGSLRRLGTETIDF